MCWMLGGASFGSWNMQCFTLTGKILAVTGTYAYTALDRLISAVPLSVLWYFSLPNGTAHAQRSHLS